jgi:redox-sensitive bicupin YhaK (pirin superfamily)
MITTRTAKQCGQADFGWLQARYTFSFGHYFDPKLLGFASLRVLNQEVLAPGASFQARTYPKVDILNLILEGEAEYRDSDGNHVQAKAGEALLIATQPGVSYSEHNLSKEQSLTRMQLWLDACPQRENPLQQKIEVADATAAAAGLAGGGITASSFASRPGSTISRWRKVSRSTCNYMVHAPTCSRFTAPSMPSRRNNKTGSHLR